MTKTDLKELYLLTLRDTLTGKTYNDAHVLPYNFRKLCRVLFPTLLVGRINAPKSPLLGDRQGWWLTAKTMVGTERLDNFRAAIENTTRAGIDGDIVECGVWRGGASIYAAGVVRANGWSNNVWLFDSFAGLPTPKHYKERGGTWYIHNDFLAVSMEEVIDSFKKYHLLDDNIHFVKGLFGQSLPTYKGSIAVLRCDGDMYESTMDILSNLYPKVLKGGVIIIDDWGVPECREAVQEYINKHSLKINIVEFGRGNHGAWFVKQQ